MARLFDAYVMVDWSAAAAPKLGRDSLWIGVLKRDIRFRPTFEAHNLATRREGEAKLREVLADLRRRGDRAFIGFDFALGYPEGTGALLKLADPSWAGVWAFIAANGVERAANVNNRFQVAAKMNRLMTDEARPFWGAPAKETQRWLAATKPVGESAPTPPPLRRTERATQAQVKGGAKSVWQLMGAGAVGGQTLTGIPAVKRLCDELDGRAAVWPFTTGWRALTAANLEGKEALIAEVYPALIPLKPEPGEVPDRAQVRALCEHAYRLDEAGKLGAAFAPPKGTDEASVAAVEREEGWIFAAGSPVT